MNNELIERFAKSLLIIRKLQDKKDAEFLNSLGKFSLQQLSIINTIGDRQIATMSEIAKHISMSLSSVTILVDKLVKQGIVKRIRDKEDRRIVRGSLTKKGNEIYQVQVDHLNDVVKKLFMVLTEEEQTTLVNVFEKITQYIH